MEENGEEVKSFAFIKVPKTGSSTMYTILSRFALDRKLDIITPDRHSYLDLDSPEAKGKTWEIGPKNHSKGDVVMHHAIYKNYLYEKYLKKDINS
ncbi:hypothetical protein EB796_006426 [Bugula neritina]|uniref:Sulfotransferase family protein n=1 Tax=Bugula neritina TaxID=10212 RepID=A0A7J7KCD2_BUGNE|nr:hypothetical protein EB796_006426 [Bugula neritina]